MTFHVHHPIFVSVDDDIDGIPLEKLQSSSKPGGGGFIPSKWETVDPDQIEAQAITTSKWDTLDNAPEPPALSEVSTDGSFDNDPRDLDEEKRSRLKKIETRVLQYQDELESGARQLKPGWTIDKQIQHYRRKLTKQMKKSEFQRDESESPDERYYSRNKRSPSPSEQLYVASTNRNCCLLLLMKAFNFNSDCANPRSQNDLRRLFI